MGPGGFRRLQNDCDLTTSGWVGSIPTRSRHGALPKSLYDLRIAKEHRHDAIVTSYTTNPTGEPVAADSLRNRYALNRVKSRRTHVEDWVAALIFNHLFSGADAYVSAHLWDLPVQLGFRAAPAAAIIRAASRD